MKQTKSKLYVIPGLGENIKDSNYKKIVEIAKKYNLKIVPIKVKWTTDKDVSDFTKEIADQIPDDSKNDYVLSFSIGSYIAINISKKKKFKGYIFCTISPFFKENLKKIPKESQKYFGEKMMKSFAKYSIPKGNKSNAWFLVGDKDWDLAIKTAKVAYKNWSGQKKLIIVKGAGHDLSHKNYVKEVEGIMKSL
jgi:hypothetical protein